MTSHCDKRDVTQNHGGIVTQVDAMFHFIQEDKSEISLHNKNLMVLPEITEAVRR
jgi:hypothetical protein